MSDFCFYFFIFPTQVTWVKLGHYRWWPARVLHPSEVPANIEKLKHDVGEFPIQFCGSNEYAWMNRGRSFLYEENDSEKVPNMDHKGGLDGAYKRGLSEAAEFFEKYSQVRFFQLLFVPPITLRFHINEYTRLAFLYFFFFTLPDQQIEIVQPPRPMANKGPGLLV